MKRENKYQSELISRIEKRFPGCFVTKLDPNVRQGVPDLLILYNDQWAILECKKSAKEAHQPNQDWYVKHFNEMSFSSFIFPENEEEVLNELQHAFESGRHTRPIFG